MAQQFSGHLPEDTQNTDWKSYMQSYVHCSSLYNSQDMEAAYVSINRQLDKEVVTRICMTEYYLAIKNEILLFSTTWVDLEGIMQSEISHAENTI